MVFEGIDVLEEWFRWGEEWSVLLRALAGLEPSSSVLEIGSGLGRIAFPLRYVITSGSYDGFEIVRQKVDFLQRVFTPKHPTFRFTPGRTFTTPTTTQRDRPRRTLPVSLRG